jgi:enoyl-CoA hydratase/carnithine racemase
MKWGLVPDVGGMPLWRTQVADDVLREMIYTNREFNGTEAKALGFATHVSDDPLAHAMELARVIANKNPHAIRGAKRLCNLLGHASDADLLQAESDEQVKVMRTPNQIEAVMSQMQKRAANFVD